MHYLHVVIVFFSTSLYKSMSLVLSFNFLFYFEFSVILKNVRLNNIPNFLLTLFK